MTATPPTAPSRCWPGSAAAGLVGRETERAILVEALDEGVGGGLGMLLVSGEAGTGKTQLVLHGAAARGFPVLRVVSQAGRGAEFDLLKRLVAALPGTAGPGLLSPVAGEHLARRVAELLIEHAGSQSLVVMMDDLQWADEETLALLPCLAEVLSGSPALMIGAYRSEEVGRDHCLRMVRARLRRTGAMRELSLTAMPDDDLRQLILRHAPDLSPAAVESILARADGIPFYAVEMAGAQAAAADEQPGSATTTPIPETLRDAVALQTARLDPGARRLLEIAAVIGAEVPLTLLDAVGQAWGAHEPAAAAALDVLIDAGLLISDRTVVRFRHSLLRDSVYASLPGHRRRRLHLQVARLIDSSPGSPREVARHAGAAREGELARRALLEAADEDLRIHAYRDAALALTAALEWWPDPGQDAEARLATIDRLAGCLEQTGRWAEALELLAELAAERRVRGDRAAEGAIHQRIARVAEQAGQWAEALRAREAAAVLFNALDRPSAAAAERLAAGMALRTAGSVTAALPMLAAARQDALRSADPGLLARVEALYGNVLARTGQAEGLAHISEALDLALRHGLAAVAAEVYHRLGDSLEQLGDYPGAQEAYSDAVDYCDRQGLDTTRQLCRACASYVLFQRGQWDDAAAMNRAVLADSVSTTHARAAAAAVLGLTLALRGQIDRARPILLDGAACAHRGGVLGAQILAAWGLAVVANEQAERVSGLPGPGRTSPREGGRKDPAAPDAAGPRLEAALAAARALLAVATSANECHYAIPSLQWGVVTFARHGCLAEARRATARLCSIAETVGHREAYAAWTHAQAEVAWLEHDAPAAAAAAQRALRIAEDTGVAHSCALLASRCGQILLEAGHHATGLATLRAARRAARHLRALPLLHRLDSALAANSKATAELPENGPPPAQAAAATALTEREAEVMSLVAGGLTSKQIAARLFLSPRTVDMHVRNSMIKLDCAPEPRQ
jgi:DNA-binding CsgD family transcriptional regulator/tetratricopeptide (TPR) repeat protein